MIKPEWGTKRLCKKCSTNFYDLGRSPIVCPKCQTSFEANDFISRYTKGSEKSESKRESKRVVESVDELVLENVPIGDNDLIEEDTFEDDIDLVEHEADEEN